MPKIILANLLNELMIATPELQYAKAMSMVTPRKIWLADENDIVITPININSDFKSYACATIKQNEDKIINLSPAGKFTEYLADRIFDDKQLFEQINYIIQNTPQQFEMLCFAVDKPTLKLAKHLNVQISNYPSFPSKNLVNLFYELNTKAGFRQLAHSLGFLIAPGIVCNDEKSITKGIDELLEVHEAVIMKFNRSSNGFGHWIIDKEQASSPNFINSLNQHLAKYNQPRHFVLEALVKYIALPSVEIFVDNTGAHLLYVCDQRCINAAYSGMVTPAQYLNRDVVNQLVNIGLTFGKYVYEKGFRGIFDIDVCLNKNDQLVVTETNFRRTAGSFIDALAKRLITDDYYKNNVWIQDAKIMKLSCSFQNGLNMIDKAKLGYNHTTKRGVISYVNTLDFDNKWRYIIFAKNLSEAEYMEEQLNNLLKLA